jgi:signal transduction histidine kinase
VKLCLEPGVKLVVSDDGCGFDVDTAVATAGHLGLRSMETRIRAVGGDFVVDSHPGRGTRIRVSLP